MPTPKIVRGRAHDLKSMVGAERKPVQLDLSKALPATPEELHRAIYEHAYSASNPPAAKQFDGIRRKANKRMALKGNNKLMNSAQI